MFEDVTFGVVVRGKDELRSFVEGAFAAIPDFKYEMTSIALKETGEGLHPE